MNLLISCLTISLLWKVSLPVHPCSDGDNVFSTVTTHQNIVQFLTSVPLFFNNSSLWVLQTSYLTICCWQIHGTVSDFFLLHSECFPATVPWHFFVNLLYSFLAFLGIINRRHSPTETYNMILDNRQLWPWPLLFANWSQPHSKHGRQPLSATARTPLKRLTWSPSIVNWSQTSLKRVTYHHPSSAGVNTPLKRATWPWTIVSQGQFPTVTHNMALHHRKLRPGPYWNS